MALTKLCRRLPTSMRWVIADGVYGLSIISGQPIPGASAGVRGRPGVEEAVGGLGTSRYVTGR
jgi:hypothetical protein